MALRVVQEKLEKIEEMLEGQLSGAPKVLERLRNMEDRLDHRLPQNPVEEVVFEQYPTPDLTTSPGYPNPSSHAHRINGMPEIREELINMFDALLLREITRVAQENIAESDRLKSHYETAIADLNK